MKTKLIVTVPGNQASQERMLAALDALAEQCAQLPNLNPQAVHGLIELGKLINCIDFAQETQIKEQHITTVINKLPASVNVGSFIQLISHFATPKELESQLEGLLLNLAQDEIPRKDWPNYGELINLVTELKELAANTTIQTVNKH